MNGAYELAKLDRILATRGTDMTLVRGLKKLPIRGRKTGYTPSELVGAMTQQDSILIISPTAWKGKDWPTPGATDWLPIVGDQIRSHGVNSQVKAVAADWMNDVVVRIYVVVRGSTG